MKTTTRIASVSLAAALTVAVAGCGSDDDSEPIGDVPTVGGETPTDDDTATDDAEDTSAPTAPGDDATETADDTSGRTESPDETATESPDESAGDEVPANLDGQTLAAYQAIVLAERELGDRAYELDLDDDTWVIDLNAKGVKLEAVVSLDGAEILSSSNEGSVDSDDIGKMQVATIMILEAIEISYGEVPGHVTAIDLETENGVVVWEVEFDDGDDDRDVYVNAQTGEIVKIDD